ncbi:MAG TPA: YeeE/YedE thiosulfate transporter family protein [Micropepsaceae bacterium]|jgi:hypothetical protein|nr:YeeE/YedE thiosulfate transporter family protein [Micropepsaceae bacterium]
MAVVLVLFLAALLGFTAHAAGLCAVKAVSEVLTTRRAYMLASFAKAVLWIMAAMVFVLWLMPGHPASEIFAPTFASVLGGFAFGVGAALNGGCAVSTVTRLGSGEMRMLLTVAGIAVAIAIIDGGWLTASPSAVPPLQPISIGGGGLGFAAALLSAWAAWEAVSLWRKRDPACGFVEGLLHHRWRLSLAAAVIGLANVGIALVAGHWAYTGTLRETIGWRIAGRMGPSWLQVALFAALMAGVVISAVLRKSCVWRCRPKRVWLRNFAGGMLMGFGIVMVPGGNDGLLLDAIPSLSPHAIPAFAALLAGVAAVLWLSPFFSDVKNVRCEGDICRDG